MKKLVDKGMLQHRIRQYLYSPSKKTFKKVYELVGLIFDQLNKHFVKKMKWSVKRQPVIGYVIGRLGKCRTNAFHFVANEMINYLRNLWRFERDFG